MRGMPVEPSCCSLHQLNEVTMRYAYAAVIAILVIGVGGVLATHPPGARSPQDVAAAQTQPPAPAKTPLVMTTGTTATPAMPAAPAMAAGGEAPHAMVPIVTEL